MFSVANPAAQPPPALKLRFLCQTSSLHRPHQGGPADLIIDEPLSEALSRRYLAYALSVITDRALPDVRDGLKPVQRRVHSAMREMRQNPDASARKCAKVVGEVMGGYHPHGDQSIYDTLVRMAQDFAQRRSATGWAASRQHRRR